jgi:hypothetical protein
MRYDTQIETNSNSAYAKIVRFVGSGKRVLNLGRATGYMSHALLQDGLQRQLEEAIERKNSALNKVDELEVAINALNSQCATLTARIELMSDRERELRNMLLQAHEQLLRRDDEIRATLVLTQNVPDPSAAVHSVVSHKQIPNKRVQYRQLILKIREVVNNTLPPDATVIVVNKGDEELLKLNGRRRGWNFPMGENGAYAGFYPANSTEAISHLEVLRSMGGNFLLFPSTALWWLDFYNEFRQYLENNCRKVVFQEDVCVIFSLHS